MTGLLFELSSRIYLFSERTGWVLGSQSHFYFLLEKDRPWALGPHHKSIFHKGEWCNAVIKSISLKKINISKKKSLVYPEQKAAKRPPICPPIEILVHIINLIWSQRYARAVDDLYFSLVLPVFFLNSASVNRGRGCTEPAFIIEPECAVRQRMHSGWNHSCHFALLY